MIKPYDAVVAIGRFQGVHIPHVENLDKAGRLSHKVIVDLGSCYQPRTYKDPWTASERISMLTPILAELSIRNGATYNIETNYNTLYDDDAWVARVQKHVAKHTKASDRVAIIGCKKDFETKRYLNMFNWEEIDVQYDHKIDASKIRELYFSDNFDHNFLTGVMPSSVLGFLMKFRETDEFAYIMEEKRVIENKRKPYEALPYPHVAVTVDAVVTQAGHILLIKRRASPGKGLWALPGGYFDAEKDDTPLDGVIRELMEETVIDVPEKVLRGSVKNIRTFSAKGRSLLGRSITHAAHIQLTNGEWSLPKVKGEDDAEKAKWFPFVDVKKEMLFDDHHDIMTSYVPGINNL